MNDNKFRKISKKELLEILLAQAKKIEELEQELTITKLKLTDKEIAINESGTLAEACLKLNGIFETAQKSADQYLLNIKEKCNKLENDAKKELLLERDNILKETEELCKKKEKEADEYLRRAKQKLKELTENRKQEAITTNKKTSPEYTKIVNNKKEVINKNRKVIKGKPITKIGKGKIAHE